MKNLRKMAVLIAAFASSASFAADVGVSVSIGQPGFYGQIDIGDYPQPRVIYREPRIIERVSVERAPVYMRVPPGHAKHWDKHCYEYRACNQRVYFVKDDWYEREYVPRYQERHRNRHENDHRGHGNGKGKDKGHRNGY
ncbi:MAG: hypothetical protein ABW049_09140 [Spongiibacteraceae bacterium]